MSIKQRDRERRESRAIKSHQSEISQAASQWRRRNSTSRQRKKKEREREINIAKITTRAKCAELFIHLSRLFRTKANKLSLSLSLVISCLLIYYRFVVAVSALDVALLTLL